MAAERRNSLFPWSYVENPRSHTAPLRQRDLQSGEDVALLCSSCLHVPVFLMLPCMFVHVTLGLSFLSYTNTATCLRHRA